MAAFQLQTRLTCGARLGRAAPRHATRRALVTGTGAAAIAAGVAFVGAAAAAARMLGDSNPRSLVQSGMAKFRKNDVEGSMEDFDAALAADPQLGPFLWQRGLSLYYLERYQEGAEQFRRDVAVNPNDMEEALWTFLCEAQTLGPEAARKLFLQVGKDSRPVLRATYACYKSGNDPEMILKAAKEDGGHDEFYALLYVGLWHEAHGDAAAAKEAMSKALQTEYCSQSSDYMADLARVHFARRGWCWLC